MNAGETEKNRSFKTKFAIAVLVFIILGLILLLLYLFFGGTTYTTSSSRSVSTQSLYCSTKSKDVPDAFFNLSDAQSPEQIIKVISNDNKIDSVTYNANIDYGSRDVAKKKEAELNVRYGLYMQENGRDMNDFSPNFSTVNNEVRINLFAKISQLSPTFAKIFLIDLSDDAILDDYNLEALSNLYSGKGFRCEKKE